MLARTVVVSLVAFLAACSGSATSPSGPGDSSAGSAGQATAGSSASSADGSSVSGSGGMTGGAGMSNGNGGGMANASGAGGANAGSGAGGASGGMSGASGAGGGSAQAGAGGRSSLSPPGKQSLIWVWLDYKNSINTVIQNKASFTHVSPALYQLNYAYTSGTPKLLNPDDMQGTSRIRARLATNGAHSCNEIDP